ncbi:MAG: platelet-activating factor acetylhydrolase IB subunit [Isosphaeraceae bacterium]|nr:platelet-activating factor acetylhydrolase IB subunit [Isosphaeraceae bacterium]
MLGAPSIPRRHRVGFALAALAVLVCGPTAPGQEPKKKAAPESATVPKPREGNAWVKMHESFLERAKKGDVDLLFLGDSITQGWGGNGKEVWERFYGPRHAANFGIGGDRTQHVLWRLENGEVEGIKPKVAVLMIGTNNSGANSGDEIAEGVEAIVKKLHEKLPETKVLLLAVFPRGEKPNPTREKLAAVNQRIAKLDDGKTVKYLDIGPKFLNEDGTLSKDIMPDFLHLTSKGYRIWADAIEPTLWSMLDEK